MAGTDPLFDEEVDVAVIGCGYAGAVAALTAAQAGASVALFEKAAEPGGISVCSAGGIRVAADADQAMAYLVRTNAGTTPEPVLRALAEGMARLPDELPGWMAGHGATLSHRPSPANYPFPGGDTFGFVYVDALEGFEPGQYRHVQGSPAGAMLFQLLERMLAAAGIPVRTGAAARSLLRGADGSVVGVVVEEGGRARRIGASGGVVLACGGFEGSPAMQAQYWPMQPVLNAAYNGNTGDGIRMAQAAGADLWHMWHFHGSYGFRHADPGYPFGIRTKRVPDWTPGAPGKAGMWDGVRGEVSMPWILLDARGRRFMNEYEPYLQDTGARPLGRYAAERQDFAALPAWLIADEDGRRLYPFGRPTWHEAGVGYAWSADNSAEIASGILRQADTLADLAAGIGAEPERLAATVARWNQACEAGLDDDWDRPPTSMMPIARPPFVYAPVWPIVSNTQGGPVHDAAQRVMHVDGHAIDGLYAAGECGSAFGFLYMSGGNIAECFVGGAIAARHAAARAQEKTQ